MTLMKEIVSFHDLVRRARTVRRFVESEPVPEAVLRELVDIARLVPSGGNQQPLRYRIVQGEDARLLDPLVAWAALLKDWKGPQPGERPTGFIVILSASGKPQAPLVDIGIAAQTIQLAAAERGYGACIMGSIKREEIQRVLGIAAEWAVHLVVALGRPGETVVLEDAEPGGGTAYYRTPDGVHHVPKRSLETVLL
jgi:nitroreductase